MFERVHRAGVDIDVGVELLHGDPKSSRFQQPPEGGSCYTFAKPTSYPTGNEDVFSHG